MALPQRKHSSTPKMEKFTQKLFLCCYSVSSAISVGDAHTRDENRLNTMEFMFILTFNKTIWSKGINICGLPKIIKHT